MTDAEKKLLVKDLCGRLPYEVKGFHRGQVQRLLIMDSFGSYQVNGYDAWFNLDTVPFKPYLRPMNTMTEEEIKEYRNLSDEVIGSYGPYHHEFTVHCVRLGIKPDNPHECVDDFLNMDAIDWLNAHYFDYRLVPSTGKTMIESNLALEAPEGMYK